MPVVEIGVPGGNLDGRIFKAIPVNSNVLHVIGGGGPCPAVETTWYYPGQGHGVSTAFICGRDMGLLPGNSVVPRPDSSLQIFATQRDGVVQTQRGIPEAEDPGFDFPDEWADIAGLTAAGPPSAILAPDGMIKIVVRGVDGFIYYTTETSPGSAIFAPWQEITNFTEESATDPTALAVPESNTWVVAYRTDLDIPRLRRYQPAGPVSAASVAFVDIPITPPGS